MHSSSTNLKENLCSVKLATSVLNYFKINTFFLCFCFKKTIFIFILKKFFKNVCTLRKADKTFILIKEVI